VLNAQPTATRDVSHSLHAVQASLSPHDGNCSTWLCHGSWSMWTATAPHHDPSHPSARLCQLGLFGFRAASGFMPHGNTLREFGIELAYLKMWSIFIIYLIIINHLFSIPFAPHCHTPYSPQLAPILFFFELVPNFCFILLSFIHPAVCAGVWV